MFSLRSTENIAHLMQPVEDAIRLQLLPAITVREALTDDERDLLALPARIGGGIPPHILKNTTIPNDYQHLLQY